MTESRMIVISDKESFIARVLIKKINEAGARCDYVPCTVNDINRNIGNAALVTLCLGDGERPGEDILHFLRENMDERNLQMIVVGEQLDIQYIYDNFPGEFIYKTFARPVDNHDFTKTVTDYLQKASQGEFKKSILVVDDDPEYLKLVREWLRSEYKVTIANSGIQAIKWLAKNKADLILLDYEMPVTSGPQVLEMLRSDTETQLIPVIFLTGKSDKKSVMAVVSLKPEGYFLKSISKDELLEKLNDFFVLHK